MPITWEPCTAMRAMTADGREYWRYQPQPEADSDSVAARWWRLVMLDRGACRACNFDDLDDAQQAAADCDGLARAVAEQDARLADW